MTEEKPHHFAHVESLKGYQNMQKDWQNLLRAESSGQRSSRLYRWCEPTLSIGYSQKPIPVNIPLVKRPTGGGALLHGQDLSFSYAGLREEWGESSVKIYKNFMGLLLEALRELEPALDMSRYRGGYENYFCYFYPTLGEITLKGKKVLACAMRLTRRAFLLHGSLFWEVDYATLENLTGVSQRELRERVLSFREMGLTWQELLRAMERVSFQIL